MQQAISACERALCHLTVCFEFQSTSERKIASLGRQEPQPADTTN